jgi:hypothetical protein
MVTPGGYEQLIIDYRSRAELSDADIVAMDAALGVSDSPAPPGAPA